MELYSQCYTSTEITVNTSNELLPRNTMYTRSNQVINGVRLIGFSNGYFFTVENQAAACVVFVDQAMQVQSHKQVSDTDTFYETFEKSEVFSLKRSLQDYLSVLTLAFMKYLKLVMISSPTYSGVCLQTNKVFPLSRTTSEYMWIELLRNRISVKDYYDTYSCKSNSAV